MPEYPDHRTEYIQSPTPVGTRKLAKKWGIAYNTICTQCTKEDWVGQRRQFQGKVKAEAEREAVETMADARLRWAKTYRSLQATGLKALNKLEPRTAGEAARIVDMGLKGEMSSRETDEKEKTPTTLAEIILALSEKDRK